MAEPIQRDGSWWHRQDDGSWLRWNEEAGQWQPASAPPPPPPPPPHAAATEPLGMPALSTPGAPKTAELPGIGQVGRSARSSPSPMLLIVLGLLLLIAGGFALMSFLAQGDGPADEPGAQPAPGAASPDGGGSSPSPVVGDKQAYITALDSICARVLAAQRALPEPQGRRDLIRYTSKAYALNHAAFRQMRKVPLPAEDGKVAERLLFLYAKALGHLERAVKAVRKDDALSFGRALARSVRAGRKYNAIATAFGFQECNKDR